jgi:hypothetical protein
VLETLDSVPITTWNYKTQSPAIRHIGPMAQDFYAAFGVGEDDTHIGTLDADGVALAAIQGLYLRTQDQQRQILAQQARIDELEQDAAALRERLASLERSLSRQQLAAAPSALSFVPLGGLVVAGLTAGWLSRRRTINSRRHGGDL